MDFENEMAANAVEDNGEGIADPMEEVTGLENDFDEADNMENAVEETRGTEESNNLNEMPDNTSAPVKNDVTQTQAFARRLRQETERVQKETQDRTIAEMNIPDPKGGYITTFARYQELMAESALREQAERQGIPYEILQKDRERDEKIKALEEHIKNEERKNKYYEDDERLKKDAQIGAFYSENESEIKNRYEQYGGEYTLDAITTVLLREKAMEIINSTAKKAEQRTIKSLNYNMDSSPGSLTDKTENQTVDYLKMSKKDFQAELEKVLNG